MCVLVHVFSYYRGLRFVSLCMCSLTIEAWGLCPCACAGLSGWAFRGCALETSSSHHHHIIITSSSHHHHIIIMHARARAHTHTRTRTHTGRGKEDIHGDTAALPWCASIGLVHRSFLFFYSFSFLVPFQPWHPVQGLRARTRVISVYFYFYSRFLSRCMMDADTRTSMMYDGCRHTKHLTRTSHAKHLTRTWHTKHLLTTHEHDTRNIY